MVKNRTIVSITLGYIIGIIWGLYFNMSIALFYIIAYIVNKILNYSKIWRKILRYIKINLSQKAIILIILSSIISSTITCIQNNKFNNLYKDITDVDLYAKVVSNKQEKEFKDIYKVKVINLNNSKKYKGTYLNIKVDKCQELKYGSYVYLKGKYEEPEVQRNYKGFDYKEYLKTNKIYGTLEECNILNIEDENKKDIFVISNNIFLSIKNIIKNNFSSSTSSIMLGILLGCTENIEEEVQKNFSDSNISHILAVSGMHITYIVLGVSFIFDKINGKRISRIITSFILLIYMFITGFSYSVVRAGIMGILLLISKVIYRKNDTWTSLSIALLITLSYNPFLIKSVSVILSYLATIGILILNKNILDILNKIQIRRKGRLYRPKYTMNKKLAKILNSIYEILSVSFSAQIFIFPIMIIFFHKIGLTFFITNFFVSIIIGPIIILGFIFLIFNLFNLQICYIVKIVLEYLINVLIKIAEIGSSLPLSKMWVITPKMWHIFLYYFIVICVNFLYVVLSKKVKNAFEIRVKNVLYLIKYKLKNKISKIAVILILLIIVANALKTRELKIYFIDVGQGDSTLIVTPNNKSILIDGGGSDFFDVGENTLLPYLLNRNIKTLDYIIISHFDTDHVGGLFTIIEELDVKNIIIPKQYESCENYETFLDKVREKGILVKVAKAGDRVNLEKNIVIDFLFPTEKLISKNPLNNNSLVLKFEYKDFSVLFTGDIEEEAEEEIVKLYDESVLNSSILKVAHHGSNSSSTQVFLSLVKPKIALIGVGKDNLYGHPNEYVLERLQNLNCKIYRTDESGEICIVINSKSNIRIRKFIE